MFLFDMNINTNVILVYRLLLKLLLKVRLLLELLSCPLRNWVFFKVNLIDKGQFSVSWASLVTQMVKNLPTMQETRVWSLGWEDPLEKEMATHSRVLGWRIPEDSRGAWWLQSMELQRVGHDCATNTHTLKDICNQNLRVKKKSPKIFIVDILVLLYHTVISINKAKQ